MALRFRMDSRPEENIQMFIDHLKKKDEGLGQFISDNLELLLACGERRSTDFRKELVPKALELLRNRQGGKSNA